jgi:Flp pilus assembly protein CpaB
MSLSLVIALNVVLDAGLLGGLAFVMSRANLLEAHEPAAEHVEVIQFPTGLVAEVEMRRAA